MLYSCNCKTRCNYKSKLASNILVYYGKKSETNVFVIFFVFCFVIVTNILHGFCLLREEEGNRGEETIQLLIDDG